MASGIMKNDNLFVVGERPWHGLGTILDEPPTSVDAIKIAHLDWEVKQHEVFADINKKKIIVPDTFANVREDTNDILGIVTKKYRICQNEEAFDFVDTIMEQKDNPVKYESAGSLFNGKKVWLLARLEKNMKLFDDEIEQYIAFENSFDGKGAIKVFATSVRVVCNNTLQMAEHTTKRNWSCRHTGNLNEKRKEAMNTLHLSTEYFDSMIKEAEEFFKIKPNFNKMLDVILPIDETKSDRIKTNTIYIRDAITNIYNNKDDLQNFRGSAWGMYNAVADYCSNYKPLRNAPTYTERKMESHMLGEIPLLKKAEKFLLVA